MFRKWPGRVKSTDVQAMVECGQKYGFWADGFSQKHMRLSDGRVS